MIEMGSEERRLLDEAVEVYEEHGLAGVHRWSQEQGLPLRLCALCEIVTEFVCDTFSFCWSKCSGYLCRSVFGLLVRADKRSFKQS